MVWAAVCFIIGIPVSLFMVRYKPEDKGLVSEPFVSPLPIPRIREGGKADPAGALRIQEAAEGPGQKYPVYLFRGDSQMIRHQLDPGGDGSLGHLQLADIVLGQIDIIRQGNIPLPVYLTGVLYPSAFVDPFPLKQSRRRVDQPGAVCFYPAFAAFAAAAAGGRPGPGRRFGEKPAG